MVLFGGVYESTDQGRLDSVNSGSLFVTALLISHGRDDLGQLVAAELCLTLRFSTDAFIVVKLLPHRRQKLSRNFLPFIGSI